MPVTVYPLPRGNRDDWLAPHPRLSALAPGDAEPMSGGFRP